MESAQVWMDGGWWMDGVGEWMDWMSGQADWTLRDHSFSQHGSARSDWLIRPGLPQTPTSPCSVWPPMACNCLAARRLQAW